MEKHQQATNIMNALLQPEDSKRVADQIIYMLEHADLDVALAWAMPWRQLLMMIDLNVILALMCTRQVSVVCCSV